jgi:hypothetical protein
LNKKSITEIEEIMDYLKMKENQTADEECREIINDANIKVFQRWINIEKN